MKHETPHVFEVDPEDEGICNECGCDEQHPTHVAKVDELKIGFVPGICPVCMGLCKGHIRK